MASGQGNLRADLRYSSWDSFFSNVMVGAGEAFFPAFALAMGSSGATSGLVTALPFMIGSCLQLFTFRLLVRVGSYRKWVVWLCGIQALCFFPLLSLAFFGSGLSIWILYLVITIYWTCGLASGSAWNAWLATIVPNGVRPRYFAKRNHLGQIGLVIGMFGSGYLLHVAKAVRAELPAFGVVFLISGLSRIASVLCLGRQSESPGALRCQRQLPILVALKNLFARDTEQGRIFAFLISFTIAVYFASPFFNAFMLKQLSLSYGLYLGLELARVAAKILAFAGLSRSRSRIAAHPISLMRLGILGAAITPFLWIVSGNYLYLAIIQVFNGIMWALYEQGLMLTLFSVVQDEERASLLSAFNFMSALAVFLGTFLGGAILSSMGESKSAYFLLFAISAGARVLSVLWFERAARFIGKERASASVSFKERGEEKIAS